MANANPIEYEYPDHLSAVPESARIPEAFGWSLLSWACILIVWCSMLFTQPAKPTRNGYATVAFAFMVALGLAFFEFYRRKGRRILVRLPEGEVIGLYKRGILERTVQVEHVTLDLRYSGAALAAVVAPVSVALGLTIFLLPGNLAISTSERIDAALGVLCFASLAASSVKTWWLCDVCFFPNEKSQVRKRILGQERILVQKRKLPQLLGRLEKPGPDPSTAEKLET